MRWYRLIGAVIVSAGVLGIGHRVTAQTDPVSAPVEFTVDGVVQPLTPLTVRLTLANPVNGAATLIVADAIGRQIVSETILLDHGQANTTIVPRGARGGHSANVILSNGRVIASTPVLYMYDPQTLVSTGIERYDQFIPAATTIMRGAILDQPFGAGTVHGYRSPDSPLIWLRDYVYQMRGARYYDSDMTSTIDAFASLQYPDGSFPDFLPRAPWADTAYRTPVEADVEFLFVQGVYQAWQAGAGDDFVRKHLGAMRRAVTYTLQNPTRWDAQKGLVRRPFTIDMWDFEVAQGDAPRHTIGANTRWGIFHGDNTGMVQALHMLSSIEYRVGDPGLAGVWSAVADGILSRLNVLSWNGQYYRHFVFDTPTAIPGVDLEKQLSLSNAYALNRGVLSDAQSDAILDTYASRSRSDAFAPWYSIDPPFPAGTIGMGGRAGEVPGSYVNGGLMPLVGGELARGAFRMGRPSFGFASLDYYWAGMLSRGRSFLWYSPDGSEGVGSPDTISTDGWGTAAMLDAFIEGAVGVVDQGDNLRHVIVSPQWVYTSDLHDAYAVVRYAAGNGYVAYRWHQEACWASIEVTGADQYHVVLPVPKEAKGCSGTVSSPNGEVHLVATHEGQAAIIDLMSGDGTVVVRW